MCNIDNIVKEIKAKVNVSGNYIGVILGTSFAEFLDEVEDKVELNFKDIPSMKVLGNDVDENKFIFGTLNGKKVIINLGRLHYCNGYESADIATPIFVLKELGCEKLILCSSLGAISNRIKVGDIATVTDHLNFTGRNPLYKCEYNAPGYKFIDMSNPYDEEMIDKLVFTAKKEMGIKVKKGILVEFPGPSAETVAESHYAHHMHGDVIGFNICNEVIAAKYCHLPIVVYSLITNYVSAYTNNKIKHEDIVYNRKCASVYYLELLSRFIENL